MLVLATDFKNEILKMIGGTVMEIYGLNNGNFCTATFAGPCFTTSYQ